MNGVTKTNKARKENLAIILPTGRPPKTVNELCSPVGNFITRGNYGK